MTPIANRANTPGAVMLGAAAIAVLSADGTIQIAPPFPHPPSQILQGINAPSETRSPAFFSDTGAVGMRDLEAQSFHDDVHVLQLEEGWEMAVEDAGPLERPDPY